MSSIKTADKLLLRAFFNTVAFIFSLFVVLAFVLILFEDLDLLHEHNAPASLGIAYVLLRLPHEILKTIPFVIVLSIMLAMGNLIRHNEMLMLYIAGYSPLRLAAPIMASLGLLVVILFFVYENVAGPSAVKAHTLMETRIKGTEGGLKGRSGIWVHESEDQVWCVQRYFPYTQELQGLSIFTFRGPNRTLSERLDAERANWVREGGFWRLEDVITYFISEHGEVRRELVKTQDYFLERTPADFERATLEPEQMSHRELSKLVSMIRGAGVEPRLYLSHLRIKEAFPFAIFFLGIVAFGVTLSIGSVGGASGIGLGLLMVVGYFMSLSLGKSLSTAGLISPWLGAWAPNLLVLGLIFYVFNRLQKEC